MVGGHLPDADFPAKSIELLSEVLDQYPGMAYRCHPDKDWCFEYVSGGARDLTGHTPERLVDNRQLTWSMLCHPDDRAYVLDQVRASIQNRCRSRLVYRIRTATDDVKWVLDQSNGVFDEEGRVLAWDGYLREIEVQQQSDSGYWRQLVALSEQSNDFIAVVDATGAVLYCNRRMRDLGPLSAQPNWERLQKQALPAALQHGSWRAESSVIDGTGAPLAVDVSVFAIHDGCTELPCFGIVQRDIRDRRQFEEKLKENNEELQQFAYVVSHDLQEPLRTIASYAQFLARRYEGQLDPEALEFVGYIVGGVRRMSSLIDGVLTLSRLGYASPAPFQPTDMEDVLRLVELDLRSAIQESGTEIVHDPLPTVVGNRSQLAQLLLNLISNAIKYRRDGEPPRVQISVERRPDFWVFTVRDNGTGFDPAYADRIFGVFQRLHGNQYPGTGIGLALCKRIVERHGGRIWVESDPGKGSDFYFMLPVNGPSSSS